MAKRRANGEGSIHQRPNGTWSAQVDCGRDPSTGKRIRKTVYAPTKRGVVEKMKALQAEISVNGVLPRPSSASLASFLAEWLSTAVHSIKPVTAASYEDQIRLHVLPTLGEIPLAKLTPAHLQQLYNALLARGLSKRNVQYTHAILRRALGQAVQLQLLRTNPALAVTAPRPDRREMQILTPEQVEALARTMEDDPLAPFFHLALATGARRGELLALRWGDIDWAAPAIRINRTAERVRGSVIFTEPKTAKSRRTIPIPRETADMLLAHRANQLQDCAQLGQLYEDHDLLFARANGRPLDPGYPTHRIRALTERAGVPPVRLHDLRHTHASMLLAANVHPKIVSERLGHGSVTLTMDTYSHVLPTLQEEVVQKLGALLPKRRQ